MLLSRMIHLDSLGLAQVLHLLQSLVMCLNFEILTAIERLKILRVDCSHAGQIAINNTIEVLKNVDDYCCKSIFEFTSEDFDFDAREHFLHITDDLPEMLGEIQASKTLAIDLAHQKRLQLPSLKSSLQSLIGRLDEFEQHGFTGQHIQRRNQYHELIGRIDDVLARNHRILN